jgi:predicted nucleotidyltransferase
MNSYKISFEQIRQDQELSDMLVALERGLKKFNIDYYLVGAVSRDVWMSGINKIAPRRTTGDIDFAIFINDKGIYEELKEYLVTNEGFNPYRENGFVLIHNNGKEVDLLPFGAIEDENRKVTIQGTGYTSIHVDGFREVYEGLLPEVEMEGHIFKFCTLSGIVLLKLIAWDDRPEVRRDDIKDISDILHHFPSMYQEVIWENHNDLYLDENNTPEFIAARVMGREIVQITNRNEVLRKRIAHILETNTKTPGASSMAIIMREYFDNTVEECFNLILEIKKGLEGL